MKEEKNKLEDTSIDPDNQSVETTSEGATDAPAVARTKREDYLSRLRESDEGFSDDDESLFGRAMEDQDELRTYREGNEKLRGYVEESPQLAALLKGIYEGELENPARFLRDLYMADLLDMSDEELSELSAATNKRFAKEEAYRKMGEEQDANFDTSIEVIKSFCGEKGMSEEEISQFMDKYFDYGQEFVLAKPITEKTLSLVYNGVNYDDDVALARSEGEVAGRNATIGEAKLRGAKAQALPPVLGQSGGGKKSNRQMPQYRAPRDVWE